MDHFPEMNSFPKVAIDPDHSMYIIAINDLNCIVQPATEGAHSAVCSAGDVVRLDFVYISCIDQIYISMIWM